MGGATAWFPIDDVPPLAPRPTPRRAAPFVMRHFDGVLPTLIQWGGKAVHQFKAGLHAGSITDRERQTLLYEIGATYESLGDPRESALFLTLQPGAYTAIVSGVGGTTGTGLVEVYTTP